VSSVNSVKYNTWLNFDVKWNSIKISLLTSRLYVANFYTKWQTANLK
jgi:hypothetical protein